MSAFMRVATLPLCFLLAGCLATGDQPTPQTVAPAPAATVVAPPPPARTPAGSGGGPRGGATTAAARGEPEEVPPDPVIQARTDCWMAVEHQKGLKGLDQRIAYVDKCVADKTKNKP